MAATPSSTIAASRARVRAARSSSLRATSAESAVDAAKNPTTPQAHGRYPAGKSVTETSTTATTTSAARSRTNQWPGRLGTDVLRGDACVALQESAVVARDVQACVAAAELVG